jgi:predicted HD phosphohydrolase
MTLPVATSVEQLLTELAHGAVEFDGEAVSVLDHGLQTATILEREVPLDRELQIAGLVHDIGTVLRPNRPRAHARAGAAFVESLFGERVAFLVAHHDEAKRLLVTLDPDYASRLSVRSLETLEQQGGLMSQREINRLYESPWVEELVILRRADDLAKDPDRIVPGLLKWRPTIERFVRQRVDQLA